MFCQELRGVIFCFLFCFHLQSRRGTARSTVQATCAAGRAASWEQRERVRRTSMTAPTSAAWWPWAASTRSVPCRLTERSRSNPRSSSHAMPWMANSPLLIKGRSDMQGFVMIAVVVCCKVCEWGRFWSPFLPQSNNYSWLPSSRVAGDVMLRVLPSRWFTAVGWQASKRYLSFFWLQYFQLSATLCWGNLHWIAH